MSIAITTAGVLVDDQARALDFYTRVLGFVVKNDIPLGSHRWLTVAGADSPEGVELLLEPDEHPAAKVFKAALVTDGIPYTSFGVADTEIEYARLVGLGVRFTQAPMTMGPVTTAVLDDTCGNLIQIASFDAAAIGSEQQQKEDSMTEWWYNNKTGEVEEGAQSLGSDRDGPFATREDAARAPEIIAERARKWAADEAAGN